MCYSIVLRHIYRCLLHYDHSSSLPVPCPDKCGDWVTNFSYDRADPFQPCKECMDSGCWYIDANGDWWKWGKSMAEWLEHGGSADTWMMEEHLEDGGSWQDSTANSF